MNSDELEVLVTSALSSAGSRFFDNVDVFRELVRSCRLYLFASSAQARSTAFSDDARYRANDLGIGIAGTVQSARFTELENFFVSQGYREVWRDPCVEDSSHYCMFYSQSRSMNVLVLVSPGAVPSFEKWRRMVRYFALDDTPGGV